MASVGGLPPQMQQLQNTGIGKLPPPLPPQAPPIPQAPVGESFSQAVTPEPGLMKAPTVVGPQRTTQANHVSVERMMSQGKQTAMQATLPSIAGGGAFLPMAVAFAQTSENGQTRVSAFLSDEQGQALTNAAGEQRQLPAFQIDDNKFLIATDPGKLGTAPYILVEQDAKTGQVAYGLTEGLQYQGTPDLGYQIARSELIEADGTRTARFNESYGAKGKPQGDMGAAMIDMMTTGGIGTAANFIDGAMGKTGRSASFTEVHVDGKGQSQSNDVSYKFLPTGQRPVSQSSDITSQLNTVWSSMKGQGGRTEESRTFVVRQDGNFQLDPAKAASGGFSLGSLKGMLGGQTPRQTVVVRPLSADYGPGQAGFTGLKEGMLGGDPLAAPIAAEPVTAPLNLPTETPVVASPPADVGSAANPVVAETVSVPTPSAPSNAVPKSDEAVLSNVLPKSTLQSVEGMLGKLKDKTSDSPMMQTATDNAIRRFKNIFGSSQGS
jgi:hypothetical protein